LFTFTMRDADKSQLPPGPPPEQIHRSAQYEQAQAPTQNGVYGQVAPDGFAQPIYAQQVQPALYAVAQPVYAQPNQPVFYAAAQPVHAQQIVTGGPPLQFVAIPTAGGDAPIYSAPPPYTNTANQEYHPENQHHVNFNSIPNGNVILPGQMPPVSKIEGITETFENGCPASNDPQLDRDPDKLWAYFMSHTESPNMFVDIHGSHEERRTRNVGSGSNRRTEHYTVTITDFRITLDVSRCVSKNWSRIVCIDKKDHFATLQTILDQYAKSTNPLKE
jgi:hypothetical protein